jgi:hypothetical protein
MMPAPADTPGAGAGGGGGFFVVTADAEQALLSRLVVCHASPIAGPPG